MLRAGKFQWLLLFSLVVLSLSASSQRSYTNRSVLAEGNWFKFAIPQAGVYKLDVPFLSSLGLNANSVPSSSIRVFGNGGGMLPESCSTPVMDDLVEISIGIFDGGDNVINGSDYILLYAEGPDKWVADSISKSFHHVKNLYSSESFYFLSIGGLGKRMQKAPQPPDFTQQTAEYQYRYFHELDTFNLLSSGKEWFGEEFSSGPGKTLTRQFKIPEEVRAGAGFFMRGSAVARAFGSNSQFDFSVVGSSVFNLQIPGVATGPYDVYARKEVSENRGIVNSGASSLDIRFIPGSENGQGWLDYFELVFPTPLRYAGTQFGFRDWNVTSPGSRVRFNITNNGFNPQVLDVSDPSNPMIVEVSSSGPTTSFQYYCERLKEFHLYHTAVISSPKALGRVLNQDLHGPEQPDYLIITHTSLLVEANRLADFHRQKNQLRVQVVTSEQVFNEFSSGTADPTAIRNFLKMYYDRAGGDSTRMPRYLLLFGDGSFDYKGRIKGNTNLVPAYESLNSLEPLLTYTSDDYFGFLADEDDINGTSIPKLAVSIGRIPASNAVQAKSMVDKIIRYHSPESLGSWRNEITLVADDEDDNLHIDDAESVASTIQLTDPKFNLAKVYLDAYEQVGAAGGAQYPEANQQINNKFFAGTLLWNYNGHGGYRRLAEETILDNTIINNLKNQNTLPLFITATCDVAPFDNPLVNSIGEQLLLKEKTGAIALMTTTRLVFAFSNRVMNNNYMQVALKRKPDGTYPTLGEASRLAKNLTYQFFGDVVNNRKFMLLGDPALTIGYPKHELRLRTINGKAISSIPDTLKALARYEIAGEVTTPDGIAITDFNGFVYASIFDKSKKNSTRANDPTSSPRLFDVHENLIYKGKARADAGKFKLEFIVPADIDYQFGKGRISLYAENGASDAGIVNDQLIVGGTGGSINDGKGPGIRIYLNDERFVSGGITNESPILIVKLDDSSGINILGSGIGHDLVAYLDNDPSTAFTLNEFYIGEVDDYRKGSVRYQLPVLPEGAHTLTIKAWDIANNSSESAIEFRIVESENFAINNVLNYPNPFTTNTAFWFDHNRAGDELRISVQIFTITGKLVKTLRNTIISNGNRSTEVQWDGTDEYGGKIGRGVYIYSIRVQTSDGKTAGKLEKLYKL